MEKNKAFKVEDMNQKNKGHFKTEFDLLTEEDSVVL